MDGEGSRPERSADVDVARRGFFATGSLVMMGGGLAAGYGTLAKMAGDFLFPTTSGKAWMFVAQASEISPGQSFAFESPHGLTVMIARKAESVDDSVAEADFIALSSICPHLGCRVHWEPHNDRFFCPCHNGVFDPQGNPVAGPPKADNQSLPHYPLRVEHGMLFIEMPNEIVGRRDAIRLETNAEFPSDQHQDESRPAEGT